MKPAADWERLLAALTVSCLLHAALLFMPYLGLSKNPPRAAAQGQAQQPAPALNAVLALEPQAAGAAATPLPAEAETKADAAAERLASEAPRPALGQGAGAGLLPPLTPTYFPPDKLTKRPQATGEPQLYTPEVMLIPAAGSLSLKLWISEFGDVIAVDIDNSDLPEAYAQAAIAGFMKLHFVPGEINGRSVGTVLPIEVRYDDSRQPPPQGK